MILIVDKNIRPTLRIVYETLLTTSTRKERNSITEARDTIIGYNRIATEFNKTTDALFEETLEDTLDAPFEDLPATAIPASISISVSAKGKEPLCPA